ncbi:MAG: hypothetical protein RBG13Loki_1381 [Promethearchaeota archaeon CR_4]|nr:MAG: hypothetical protein RBG13Loki_1381 [Candidatus Lokiarchaeota archaeon CR_4]
MMENDPNLDIRARIQNEKLANLGIDNTKLNGFLDFFKTQNCYAMCDECNYCETWGKKAVTGDAAGIKRYIDGFKDYQRQIVSSEIFGIKKPKAVTTTPEMKGMDWNPETFRIYTEMIDDSPPEYQMMARIVISSLAEKYAKIRGSNIIENPDMVSAFMEGVPGPWQADMKAGLKKHDLLPGEAPVTTTSPLASPPGKVTKKAAKKTTKKTPKKASKKAARKPGI